MGYKKKWEGLRKAIKKTRKLFMKKENEEDYHDYQGMIAGLTYCINAMDVIENKR